MLNYLHTHTHTHTHVCYSDINSTVRFPHAFRVAVVPAGGWGRRAVRKGRCARTVRDSVPHEGCQTPRVSRAPQEGDRGEAPSRAIFEVARRCCALRG